MAKIVIVEDDDATRAGYRELLNLAGHEVIATSTYQEGRQAVQVESPDLVIADLRLGGFNGLQLLLLSPRPIPTIIVTGFPDQVLEAEARRAGADYVVKPISPACAGGARERKTEDGSSGGSLIALRPSFLFPGRQTSRVRVTLARALQQIRVKSCLSMTRGAAAPSLPVIRGAAARSSLRPVPSEVSMLGRRSHIRVSIESGAEGILSLARDIAVRVNSDGNLVGVCRDAAAIGEHVRVVLADDHLDVLVEVIESKPVICDGAVRHRLLMRRIADREWQR
jgi:CheY-like chemotaxis protein